MQSIRTQGDGTEYPETISQETGRKVLRSTSSSAADSEKVDKLGKQYLSKKIQSLPTSIYNPIGQQEIVNNFPREVTPKGKKFYLIPKLVPPKSTSGLSLKNKSPKLILLEPYRACISPMIPFKESNNKVRQPKSNNKNNLDLNELVRHMNITKTSALNENFSNNKLKDLDGNEFTQLRKERDHIESQLKFQMQVNSELKGLLVHCLGEDIQSKVSNLTEDKMKIAEHLSTNTEKIEYLAGQCEVFRSKFLASSLMVEELAKWKASLTEKNQQLIASNKKLLETFGSVRDMQIELYQNLKFLAGFQENNLKSSNVVDLTGECLNISQQLVLNSGKIGMPESAAALNSATLDPLTNAQKQALNAIEETNEFLLSTDEASKAVCSQANQEYRRVRTQSEDTFEMLDVKDAK